MGIKFGGEDAFPTLNYRRTNAGAQTELQRQSPNNLVRLIEGQIIPRLLVVHRSEMPERTVEPALPLVIDAADADRIATIAIEKEADILLDEVELYMARGFPIETVMLDLLSPAARILGEYWEKDRCDFIDVTMALWRLQEIVHTLASAAPGFGSDGYRRALFAVYPGEQHSFGMVLVEEFFRRAGWSTERMPESNRDDLLGVVADSSFEVVGLTVSCEDHIEALPALVGAMRRASRNPDIGIMVGGRLFVEDPGLAFRVGADATAPDARQAVIRAEMFVELQSIQTANRG